MASDIGFGTRRRGDGNQERGAKARFFTVPSSRGAGKPPTGPRASRQAGLPLAQGREALQSAQEGCPDGGVALPEREAFHVFRHHLRDMDAPLCRLGHQRSGIDRRVEIGAIGEPLCTRCCQRGGYQSRATSFWRIRGKWR